MLKFGVWCDFDMVCCVDRFLVNLFKDCSNVIVFFEYFVSWFVDFDMSVLVKLKNVVIVLVVRKKGILFGFGIKVEELIVYVKF